MAALADKERGVVFNNFQTELSNGNECSSFPITASALRSGGFGTPHFQYSTAFK